MTPDQEAAVQRAVDLKMPLYLCHKKVRAVRIGEIFISGAHWRIIPHDNEMPPFEVKHDYFRKHNPQAGGYYIVYADGYESYSPRAAFEDGYTRVRAPANAEGGEPDREWQEVKASDVGAIPKDLLMGG